MRGARWDNHCNRTSNQPEVWFQPAARTRRTSEICVVSVGALERPYKGADVLLRALKTCADEGTRLQLVWVGGGRLRGELADMATRLGLGEAVRFVGWVGPDEVRGHLDSADLFVLPSRTEGLPRALLEAQARSLPCLASNVGGTPEIVHKDGLFDSGSAEQLAELLLKFSRDCGFRKRLCDHSLDTRERLSRPDRLAGRELSLREAYAAADTGGQTHLIGGSIRLRIDASYRWTHQLHRLFADVLSSPANQPAALTLNLQGAGPVSSSNEDHIQDSGYAVTLEAAVPGELTLQTRGPGIEWLMWSLQVLLLQASSTFVHAAGVVRNGRAYLIAASGGTGKTATIAHLVSDDRTGLRLLGDDLTVVTRDGLCHGFPKAMALYAYHKQLPKVSAAAPRMSSKYLEPFRGAKQYIRHWPALLGYVRDLNPFVTWQPPSAAFGRHCLQSSGRVAGLIWLERADVAESVVESDFEIPPSQLAEMTLNEFDAMTRKRWYAAAPPGWLRDTVVPADTAAVMKEVLEGVPSVRLRVPRSAATEVLAANVLAAIDAMEQRSFQTEAKVAVAPAATECLSLQAGAF